jgi:Flp pilus assembly secretin CpaC
MSRVNNLDTKVETPLPQLRKSIEALQPGQKIEIENTKEEILRTRENLTRRRAELPGADDHLDYIEALLIAEANDQLRFKK